ncbi:hypothetical protein [Cellulosimicrobium protaetiae]|uniref:Uncharacterized protein n=1 Tax=Cellulosimicrobium protaetiae TaxID=2587808 RepID=A0A6M5UBN4_9MICO|nr:hypothetical protein [Cellulosimicrobium protaetiae]QJW35907.1 hypothetical protein FIC82_006565 [Cellulosimicrobium protaetiae]
MTTPPAPRPDGDDSSAPRPAPHDAGREAGRAAAEPAPAKEREAPARLSLTQVVASSLAAVSTTVLLSYFGTAGTIIGAGIASALTVVANYVYTRSIQKTREQLVPVVGKVVQVTTGGTPRDRATTTTVTTAVASVPRGTVVVQDSPPDAGSTAAVGPDDDATAPGETAVLAEVQAGDDGAPPAPEETQNRWLRLVDRYGRGRVLTVSALALFVVVMGVVLVVELAIGKPISDAVRGVEGSGTTISRERSTGTDTPATPAPSSPAVDPSTVPTQEPAPAPSTTPTDEPTTTPSPDPTDEPTLDPSPEPTTPEPDPPTDPGTGEGTGTGSGEGAEAETGGSTGTSPTPAPSTPPSA